MSLTNNRVCMVAYTTYSYDARVRREAETLVTKGQRVITLIVPKEGRTARRYELNGVKIRELEVPQYQGKRRVRYALSYAAFMAGAFWVCLTEFFRGRTRVYHIHNMPDLLVLVAMLPRLLGAEVILDVHDTMAETYAAKYGANRALMRRVLEVQEQLSCRLASRVIAVNDIQARILRNRGVPEWKLTVLLNVPDHRLFAAARRDTGIDPQSARIVYHGTVAKRLGVELLMNAMKRVIETIPDAHAYVFGTGDALDEFQTAASRSVELRGCITFSGGVALERIPGILSTMDVGVVPNLRSPATELMLPVKMMEYFAAGVPVVASDLPAIRHHVSEEAITYFEPGNLGQLSDALLSLLTNPARRNYQRSKGFEFIRTYGWQNHQFDLLTLYSKIGSEKDRQETQAEFRAGVNRSGNESKGVTIDP